MAGHGPPPVMWDLLQWSFLFRVWYCLMYLAELLLIWSNFVQMFISIANEVFSVSQLKLVNQILGVVLLMRQLVNCLHG